MDGKGLVASWGEWIEKRPCRSSLAFTVLWVSLVVLSFRIFFKNFDDVFILLLLKGAGVCSAPTDHTLVLNPLLSTALASLYRVFPGVEWYSWFLVGLEALSVWALALSCLLGRHGTFRAALMLFGSAVYVYLMVFLQWTTVASLAAMGGVFLLAALWQNGERRPRAIPLLLAGVLLTASALLRSTSFYLVALLSLPLVFSVFRRAPENPARSFLAKLTLALAAACILFSTVEAVRYCGDPEWSKAARVFRLHNDLVDFHQLEYGEATKPVYDSMGWTMNDLDLFTNWYFLDETAYSIGNMEKMKRAFSRFNLSKNPTETFEAAFSLRPVQYTFWTAVAMLFLVPRRRWPLVTFQWLWVAAVAFGVRVCFKIPERVLLPMAAFLIAMAVFHSEPVQADAAGKRPWNKWAQAAAIAAVVLINLKGILWIHQEGGALRGYSTALQEPLSRFAPQRDQLYVVWGSAFPFRLFSAFGEFSVFKNMNMVSLAWYQRTPVTRAMLERFGVKDLFPDLVDNPHLFLVCNPWQANAYKVYMIEKHNKMVHLSQAFSSAFFNVFQVRGESPGLDEAINMVK